jgi:hypothetical protein
MLAYKIKSSIDKNGNVLLRNLPFKDKESVEIIILLEDNNNKNKFSFKLKDRIKRSIGTISSKAIITDQDLSRDGIYGSDGR